MLKKAVGSYVLRKKVEANWLDAHTHRIALHTYPIKDKGIKGPAPLLISYRPG